MKCVSLLMVVTLSLTSTPAYAYATTPVDGNDDISLPRIPTAQHGCNGCVGKESDRIMTTSEKHPKIHRIALVDNDPRALDSLSAVIACKVPTAYVVWTATSGDEAIERCRDANSNVSLLILDSVDGGFAGACYLSSVAFDGQAYADSWCDEFSIKSYRDKLVEAGAQGLLVRRMPTSWRRLLCVCAMAR